MIYSCGILVFDDELVCFIGEYMHKNRLYDAVRKHDFAEGKCFLCGNSASKDISKEHVFPKWLLHYFGLWDKHITLINGTQMPYRSLVIPCCCTCNNVHLSKIENIVKSAFFDGVKEMKKVDREILMLWMLKIFYGLLYREVFLPMERQNINSGTIVTSEDMEHFSLLHYMLQASRVPMNFSQVESDIPASIYIFELKEPKNKELRFDYKDDVFSKVLYLRMGNVGILAAFDMGAQSYEGARFFPKYQSYPLHPIQFEELGAYLFMKARKFNRTPKVIFSESPKGIRFHTLPMAGLSTKPVFDDFSQEELGAMLMFFLHYPKEVVMPVQGRVATWLHNEDGSFYNMDIDNPPWSDVTP